jgi:ADP-heptose:LPS heptosyltransferase
MLPGVDDVVVFDAPWVSFEAPQVDPGQLDRLVDEVRFRAIDEAFILTSFHQSPLPLALLLRRAGVRWIGAACVDYPGSLLDLRHSYLEDVHEVEQSLDLCAAAGFGLPEGDSGRLAVDLPPRTVSLPEEPYVVVHPGASVPARALPVAAARATVAGLNDQGCHVAVSGTAAEAELVELVASAGEEELVTRWAGTTTLEQFAHLLAGASAVVCGNTGPAHLAAAVGTPVVEAFAAVVPPHRWHPWGVPHVLLGSTDLDCAGCRSRQCPVPGQPCLEPFTADAVLDAVRSLTAVEVAA